MKTKILEVLQEIRPEYDFENSDDFIEDGLLDSFDLVRLVAELDEIYTISIDGEDILPENFSSIENIINLIQKITKPAVKP
jgi:acyl carrier protein